MTKRPEPELTATEAAKLLGVTPSRVYQLLDEQRLTRGPGGQITLESIHAHQDERRPAGRPRRSQ